MTPASPKPLTEAELKEMERIFQGDLNSYSGCAMGLRLIAEVRRLRGIYLPLSVRNGGPDGLAQYYYQTKQLIEGLQAEVRRLREALEHYGTVGLWEWGVTDLGPKLGKWRPAVFAPIRPDLRGEPGHKLARITLGWEYPPPGPCDNPSCDGIKDDKTDGERHRCFKDGRWLDDGGEM